MIAGDSYKKRKQKKRSVFLIVIILSFIGYILPFLSVNITATDYEVPKTAIIISGPVNVTVKSGGETLSAGNGDVYDVDTSFGETTHHEGDVRTVLNLLIDGGASDDSSAGEDTQGDVKELSDTDRAELCDWAAVRL